MTNEAPKTVKELVELIKEEGERIVLNNGEKVIVINTETERGKELQKRVVDFGYPRVINELGDNIYYSRPKEGSILEVNEDGNSICYDYSKTVVRIIAKDSLRERIRNADSEGGFRELFNYSLQN